MSSAVAFGFRCSNGLALMLRSKVLHMPREAFGFQLVKHPHITRPIGILSRNGQTATKSEETFKAILRRFATETRSQFQTGNL
ncbi:hypothetical protein [Thalassovita sp.]|jgi:hypothetical protein|uniref:hypothetical protein n=1 Tax=Thalassovita sp. TaxID=1979401 RepID=UPI003B5A6B3C